MEDLLKEILSHLGRIDSKLSGLDAKVSSLDAKVSSLDAKVNELETKMNERFDQLNRKIDDYQAENITADEKLLTMIGVTNDRLDYQLGRIGKVEEEIYLLKLSRQA